MTRALKLSLLAMLVAIGALVVAGPSFPPQGGGGGGGAGSDTTAVHNDTASELSALTLVTAASGDHVLIEDASDSNNKKRIAASDFLGGVSYPLLAGWGTASAPSYSFDSGEGDIGWYLASANNLGLAASGTLRATINGSYFIMKDDYALAFGESTDALVFWGTAQTSDALIIGVPSGSAAQGGSVLLLEASRVSNNYAHAAETNPTLFVHSATAAGTDADEYLGIRHDGTNGQIELGVRTTDSAPSGLLIAAQDAYPSASTNLTGSDLILAGGLGRKVTEVTDYTQTVYTVTVTVNGTATVLTEGTDWTNATSNSVSAGLLATQISAITGVTAAATAAVVEITPDPGTYSLKIAESGTGNTVTNSPNGEILFVGAPGTQLSMSAVEATVSGVAETLDWDTENYDPAGWHSTSTNPSRITVTTAGVYTIYYGVEFASNSTGDRNVTPQISGVSVYGTKGRASASGVTYVTGSFEANMVAGDYVTLAIVQDSGGALNVGGSAAYQAKFGVRKVAEAP